MEIHAFLKKFIYIASVVALTAAVLCADSHVIYAEGTEGAEIKQTLEAAEQHEEGADGAEMSELEDTHAALVLTIEEAQQIAVGKSKQARIDDLEITTKQTVVEKAYDDAKKGTMGYTYESHVNYNITKEVKPMQAQDAVEAAKLSKGDGLRKLKLDVYKKSMSVFITKKKLETEIKKLDIMEQSYEIAKAKLAAETITAISLLDTEYNIENKRADIENLQDELKTVYLEIKRLLSLPLDDSDIEITGQIDLIPDRFFILTGGEKVSVEKLDIYSIVDSAIEKDTGVFQKQRDVAAKEKILEFNSEFFKPKSFNYDDAMYNLESAKLDLEDGKTKIEVDILNKYNDLLTKLGKVDLATKFLVVTERQLKSAQIRYDAGTISSETLLSSQEKNIDAQLKRFVAVYDYIVTKADFIDIARLEN